MPPDGMEATGRLRLGAYALGLAVAFALYLLVQGPGAGLVFWGCGLPIAAVLTAGALRPVLAGSAVFKGTVQAALGLALCVPLAPALAAGLPVARLADMPLWPQALVALFASRVLAELCDRRFAAFWQAPSRSRGPVSVQSTTAALALGAALTLLFYQAQSYRHQAPDLRALASPARADGTSLGGMVANALAGESAVHRAIVFLFFVVLACLIDMGLRYRRDRETLVALRRELARHPRQGARQDDRHDDRLAGLLAGPLRPFAHTRTVQVLSRTLAPQHRGTAGEAFDGFDAAARRFVRGLLPLLPLLGFFGTVVGLSTAMAALPADGGSGSVDLSGSLAGLALKFETTLLGLLASMVASLLLASLEKAEAELVAECAVLAAPEPSHDP